MSQTFLRNRTNSTLPFEVLIPNNMTTEGQTGSNQRGSSFNNNPNYSTNLTEIIQNWINTDRVTIPTPPTTYATNKNVLSTLDYTLLEEDAGNNVILVSSDPHALIVSDSLPEGSEYTVIQGFTGAFTVTAFGGATLLSAGSLVTSSGPGSVVRIRRVGPTEVSITGDLA